jgi:hypothetical protein
MISAGNRGAIENKTTGIASNFHGNASAANV